MLGRLPSCSFSLFTSSSERDDEDQLAALVDTKSRTYPLGQFEYSFDMQISTT